MAKVISSVPTSFDAPAFAGRWARWADIAACFWPGAGNRSERVNLTIAPVRLLGGVYCLAWSVRAPKVIGPTARAIRYIGESGEFRRRMGQFASSAGFWGDRANGHSAGWRWPEGHTENTWVGFFPVGNDLLPHLAAGMRLWMEAVALEEFRLAHDRLPEINEAVKELEMFEN